MFFELLQRTLHLNFIKKPWGPFGLPAHGKIADQSVHAHPAFNGSDKKRKTMTTPIG
jgi:hypothetical protein